MTLQKAIKNGTLIRRKGWVVPLFTGEGAILNNLTLEDVLASDWEVVKVVRNKGKKK